MTAAAMRGLYTAPYSDIPVAELRRQVRVHKRHGMVWPTASGQNTNLLKALLLIVGGMAVLHKLASPVLGFASF